MLWFQASFARYFAGLFSLLATHAFGFGDCHPGQFASIALNSEQIVALDAYKGEGRASAIVEGVVDGKKRLVVLMGETHVNDSETIERGRQVVDSFPVRGVEGFNGSLAWKAMKNFAYFVESVRTFRFGGSLISYSYASEKLSAKVDKIVKRHGLETKSNEELRKFRYKFGEIYYTGEELLRLKAIAPRVSTIHLEAGLKPTWEERGAAWAVVSSLLAYRLWAVPALVSLPTLDFQTAAIGFAASFATLVGSTLYHESVTSAGGRKLRPRRDTTMSDNILDYFKNHPDEEIMLVVVGNNHVQGIGSALSKQGFESSHFPYDKADQLKFERGRQK